MNLTGNIVLSKRLLNHAVWLREPPSYGQAWVDLLCRANDRERLVTLNGEAIEMKRGQLAWSQRALEREWNRSGEWIQRFLKFCRDNSMILVDATPRKTIITILNYEAYQPVSEPGTETDSEAVSEPGRKGEGGIGRTEEGMGILGPVRLFEIPGNDEVASFCASFCDLARGIQGIPEVWWRGWLANMLCRASFPRDWKRCLGNAFVGDFIARHPKAIGGEMGKKNSPAASDVPPPPGGKTVASVDSMREACE